MDTIAIAKKVTEHPPGDFSALIEHLDEAVVFRMTIPEGTPGSGEFRGKEAVIKFFTDINPQLATDVRLERPLEYLSNGAKVVILGEESFKVTRSGVRKHLDFAFVLEFRGELITRILIIQDLSAVADAFRTNDN